MKKYRNLIIIVLVFIIGIITLIKSGLVSELSIQNLPELREQFLSLGSLAVLAYFGLYIIAVLFALPGTPLTLLGGILFGPLFGTIYTVLAASIGLALSFLFARYAVRNIILDKFGTSPAFKKIDEGVKNEGWRILMITRLVPMFPFSIQNYVYGLTDINFFLYWGLSTLFIIPGTAAYTLSVGAITSGEFSPKNLIYLGIGAICFVIVSFIPKFIKKKEATKETHVEKK